MNYCELLQKLVRRRRSFARFCRLCITICALFICCIGGTISVSAVSIPAGSIDEGQPTTSNSQNSETSSSSLLSWLWFRSKRPETTVSSSQQENVITQLPTAANSELKANISVEPFDSNRELGPAEWGSRPVGGLGFIKLIEADNSTAEFFSCSFGIYSRNKSIAEIKTKNNAEHLFDLNLLAPENGVFSANRRTIIVIAGYRSEKYEQWMHDVKDLWLNLEDVNVILVDWNEGSGGFYATVVRNTRIVGRQIVILLYYLAKLNHADFNSEQFRGRIHLIGHSCGAHIAGFVGNELGGKVDRITGLDPAGPIFDPLNATERLNAKSAKFVDIIHTNSGESLTTTRLYTFLCQLWFKQRLCGLKDLLSFSNCDKNQLSLKNMAELLYNREIESSKSIVAYGIEKQIGHVDYYVNGGAIQPGCNDQLFICDHNRAIIIYLRVLEYQLKAKLQEAEEEADALGDINKQADLHRLIAFAANGYEEYKTGASLVRNCPQISLSSPAALENLSNEGFDEAFKRCMIPIDFVKSADEYRKELPADATSGDIDRTTRYYFDTLAQDPFVSDYYLMRMHVPSLAYGNHDQRWSREQLSELCQCKLFSSIRSVETDNKQRFSPQLANYRPWDYTAAGNYYSHLYIGLILPLLNPNDWRLHFPMRRHIYRQIQESIESDAGVDRPTLVLPNVLSIGSIQQKQQTNVNSVIGNNASQTSCNISYSDIELSPLTRALARSYSLWFSLDNDDDCHAELNSTTARKPIIISKPYKVNHSISLNWSEQVCSIPLKTISLLSEELR